MKYLWSPTPFSVWGKLQNLGGEGHVPCKLLSVFAVERAKIKIELAGGPGKIRD